MDPLIFIMGGWCVLMFLLLMREQGMAALMLTIAIMWHVALKRHRRHKRLRDARADYEEWKREYETATRDDAEESGSGGRDR
jgi:hypothetical protein